VTLQSNYRSETISTLWRSGFVFHSQGVTVMAQQSTFGDTKTARDKAGEQTDKVADGIENFASAAMKRGGDVQEAVGNARSTVESSVRNSPITTLAITAALGFLLGAAWKR
jgi:ElaB/YqjD/DUF883 family membrane-anchored ribosome-binding protein